MKEKRLYFLVTLFLFIITVILIVLLHTSGDLIERKVNVYYVEDDEENDIYELEELENNKTYDYGESGDLDNYEEVDIYE